MGFPRRRRGGLSRRDEADVNYDPRQRQWYQLARAGAGAVARTRPYLFASSKQIGVTLSRSLDGPVEGAFGADVAIGELSRFLAAQKITPTSRVFIFNAAGEFVAGRGYFNSAEILACNRAGIAVTLPKPMTSGAKSEIGSSSETTEGAPTPPLS